MAPGDYTAGERPAHLHARPDDEDGHRDGQRRSPRRGERDVRVNLSNAGATRRSRTAGGVGTITDDDPTPTLSVDDVTVLEGDTGTVPAVFTVTLSAPSGRAISVAYATANNTAIAPADYLATSGTLNFAAGETTKTVTVTVNGEDSQRGERDLLPQPERADERDAGRRPGARHDHRRRRPAGALDQRPGGLGAGPNANFTVTLSASSGQTVTVDYATANGTATAPARLHRDGSGTLTFTPGQTHEDRPRSGAERHARRERRNVLGQPVRPCERDDRRRAGRRRRSPTTTRSRRSRSTT